MSHLLEIEIDLKSLCFASCVIQIFRLLYRQRMGVFVSKDSDPIN